MRVMLERIVANIGRESNGRKFLFRSLVPLAVSSIWRLTTIMMSGLSGVRWTFMFVFLWLVTGMVPSGKGFRRHNRTAPLMLLPPFRVLMRCGQWVPVVLGMIP